VSADVFVCFVVAPLAALSGARLIVWCWKTLDKLRLQLSFGERLLFQLGIALGAIFQLPLVFVIRLFLVGAK
jgi:hypothetical protein